MMEEDSRSEIRYEVPGQDIVNKLIERATVAEQVAKDLRGPDDSEPDSPCELGMFRQATDDAAQLRLRAMYLSGAKTYILSGHTLAEIFFQQSHYANAAQIGIGSTPSDTVERSW